MSLNNFEAASAEAASAEAGGSKAASSVYYDALQGAYFEGASVICASVGDPDRGVPSIAEWLDRVPSPVERAAYEFVWKHNFLLSSLISPKEKKENEEPLHPPAK